ncbi:3-isopropylmalate dehydrogenase, partial [Streptomyces sp. NPDC006368]
RIEEAAAQDLAARDASTPRTTDEIGDALAVRAAS